MITCTKCNRGDMRKDKGAKTSYCTNAECEDSFYQRVIVEKKVIP